MADKSTPPVPQNPKLSLKRETLRTVSGPLLDAVVGGVQDTSGGGSSVVGSTTGDTVPP